MQPEPIRGKWRKILHEGMLSRRDPLTLKSRSEQRQVVNALGKQPRSASSWLA